MLTVAAYSLFKEVTAPLRPVAAGQQKRHSLSLPQRWPFLYAVELVHTVYQTVQQRFHGRCTVPRVNGRGQNDEVAGEDGKASTIKYISLTDEGLAFNPDAAE